MSDRSVTGSVWSRDLTCYRDSEKSVGVCGECGRPVCRDHHRTLHDSTFHHYEDGSKRAVAVIIGIAGIPVVFGELFPNLIPGVIQEVLGRPLFFTDTVIHSSIILAVALGVTLRFQSGERRGDFRLLVRRIAKRDFCDDCYEDTFLQRALYYGLVVVAAILVLIGLRDLVTQEVLLPLRTVAVGVALWLIRDDVVAYIMHLFETDEHTVGEDAELNRKSRADTTVSSTSTNSNTMASETDQPREP